MLKIRLRNVICINPAFGRKEAQFPDIMLLDCQISVPSPLEPLLLFTRKEVRQEKRISLLSFPEKKVGKEKQASIFTRKEVRQEKRISLLSFPEKKVGKEKQASIFTRKEVRQEKRIPHFFHDRKAGKKKTTNMCEYVGGKKNSRHRAT